MSVLQCHKVHASLLMPETTVLSCEVFFWHLKSVLVTTCATYCAKDSSSSGANFPPKFFIYIIFDKGPASFEVRDTQ